MDAFLTATCDHWNNPTGLEDGLVEVATGITCTPIHPADNTLSQGIALEEPFMLRQTFTEYTAFAPGDRLISGGVTFTVKSVHSWAAQGGLGAYYHILVEQDGS